MALTLQTDGTRVEEFGDAAGALARAVDDPSVGLVVTDLKMPGKTGLELATELAAARPDVSVLIVTAFGDVETLLAARALGTVDYVAKPVAKDDLRLRAAAALRARGRRARSRTSGSGSTSATASRRSSGSRGRWSGSSRGSAWSRRRGRRSCRRRVGNRQGAGRERAPPQLAAPSRAFVALNCGAIPKEIIESELFGHERGAFTGALVKRVGRIEQAHGGTLFLDEVSEMPPDLQVKFLRVLEEQRVTPVGGNETKDVDFRLIAATNRDLAKEIETGRFRAGPLLPPVGRHRRDPAAPRAQGRHPAPRRALPRPLRPRARADPSPASRGAAPSSSHYEWPGNVRELKNVVESAVLFAAGREDRPRRPPAGRPGARPRAREAGSRIRGPTEGSCPSAVA